MYCTEEFEEELEDDVEPCKYRNIILDPEYVDDDKDRDD